jgi:ssDNA-binding Zn-finger/Zn-ribbon topoisomerase 1
MGYCGKRGIYRNNNRKEGSIMKCTKCGGFMVSQRFADYFITFYGWKCVNCGSIVDKTIVQNRLKASSF